MEVELDLWSSRDDAVDHILSHVDCLGDVVADVDVDEFMLACSSAEASQVAGPGERAASFTAEPPLHHHDLTASVELHHLNLNSIFDHHQQHHQTATTTFQHHPHQAPEQLHFEASRLTPNDLHHQHHQQHQFEQQSHYDQPHPNDLDTLNSLVIEHQSGAPFVHQFVTSHTQQQQHQQQQLQQQQASSPATSSSLVAARVDHCYITADWPSANPKRSSADQLEPMSRARLALPDREQLQMLLDSRPQPISCPLGESPLIAVMNSKSQEPLSQSKGALKRRQSQANASSPKRQTKKQQQAASLTIKLDGCQTGGVISSSEEVGGSRQKSGPRNNNAKRAETMALNGGATKGAGRVGRPKKGAGAKLAQQLAVASERQKSGQISPTLSSTSSSGVSSNYSDELGADAQVDDCATSSQLYPHSEGQPVGASACNKQRRQQTPTGANKKPSPGKRMTSAELQAGNSSVVAEDQGGQLTSEAQTGENPNDKLGHGPTLGPNSTGGGTISSSWSGKSASQMNFEANLSQKSREKLSSLSSCLIQPIGGSFEQQQQQQQPDPQPSSSPCSTSASHTTSVGSIKSSSNIEQAIKAPKQPSAGRQRSSVSSSSSVSSCSSTSSLAASPPNSVPSSSSCSSGNSPSSSSCTGSSFSSFSSMRSAASERLASPVSSASCSPTMQLAANSTANPIGFNSSSSPTATSSSSCSFSSSTSFSTCSSSAYSAHQSAALISSQDWKSAASGQTVQLTEEERRTLLAAGYPIPQKFPLSKAEERSLKKIRRKIKNKISAQESRRKKKEYMEELEKRVQLMELRISELERENERLLKERRGSPSTTSSNWSPSSTSKSNGAAIGKKLKRSQQRSRQKNQPDNKDPSTGQNTTTRAQLTTPMTTPTLQQPKSLDLLRSFTVKQQEPGTADGQLVIAEPRKQTQTVQQVDSFQLIVGACESLVDRSEPDSAQPALKRKDSIQSQANDDDNFIDQILLSQERQEAVDSAGGAQTAGDDNEVDLVANLVGGGAGGDQQIVDVDEPSYIKVERHEMVVELV